MTIDQISAIVLKMCQNYSVFILVRDKWNNFCVDTFHFDEKLRCTYSIVLADIGTTRIADPIKDIANYYAGHTYMYFKALTVICRLAVLRAVIRSRNATKTGQCGFRERLHRPRANWTSRCGWEPWKGVQEQTDHCDLGLFAHTSPANIYSSITMY